MVKIDGFLDCIMKNFKKTIFYILYVFIINNIYCSNEKNNNNNENIKEDNIEEEEETEEAKKLKLKKKKEEEAKKLLEQKRLEELKKKKEIQDIKDTVKSFKQNDYVFGDNKNIINDVISDVKKKEKETIEENKKKQKKLKKKKNEFIKNLEKKVAIKDKELIDKNNLPEAERLKEQYKEMQNEYIRSEINKIINLPNANNLTKSFEEELIRVNTKFYKQKYLKFIKIIDSIEFCSLDFFNILLYFVNLKNRKGDYVYEILFNPININWGIVFSTGIEGGISFLSKNNIKTNFPFVNLALGVRYNKRGNIKLLLGLSRVNIDNDDNYMIPLWWGITPLNVKFDVYKFKEKPMSLFLNVEIIFKRIITSDLRNFMDRLNTFPYNDVCPYIRSKNALNILSVYMGFKVSLGFKYTF